MYKKLSCFIILFITVYLLNTFVFIENVSVNVGEKAVITTFNQLNLESKEGFFEVHSSDNLEIIGKKIGTEDATLNILGLPIKTVSVSVNEKQKLIPVGATLGIRINTKGVLVLGTGNVTDVEGKTTNPAKDKVYSGDIIYKVNDKEISSKEELVHLIETSIDDEATITLSRKNELIDITIPLVKSIVDYKYKIGIWVRDSTQGIGTMTYINPETNEFGALGHGILDIDTKELMTVKNGNAYISSIVSVTKGSKGVPGELVGEITINDKIGTVEKNEEFGIKGKVDNLDKLGLISDSLEIASIEEVVEGYAEIFCNIDNKGIERFSVDIQKINKNHKDNKNFVVKITDERLLKKTSGIVQGMSGSPIIQNNKIIGAITHVFVQDPSKGYGIYIKNMM